MESSLVSVGVYLNDNLIPVLPKRLQEDVWLLKIKKKLGGLSGIEGSITNQVTSFKDQYKLLSIRELSKLIARGVSAAYLVLFLDLEEHLIPKYLSRLPKLEALDKMWFDLIVRYGHFSVLRYMYESFPKLGTNIIEAFKEAVRWKNYKILRGILSLIPSNAPWSKVFEAMRNLKEQKTPYGQEYPMYTTDFIKSLYSDLLERFDRPTAATMIAWAPTPILVKMFFKEFKVHRKYEVESVEKILNQGDFELIKILYPKLTATGAGEFMFDKDVNLSTEALKYLYEKDRLVAVYLDSQINLKLRDRNLEALGILFKVGATPYRVYKLFKQVFKSNISLEFFEEVTNKLGKYLLFSDWEKLLTDQLINDGYTSQKIRDFIELFPDPLRDKFRVIQSIKKLSQLITGESNLDIVLRLLEGQRLTTKEAAEILGSYRSSKVYTKVLLALLTTIPYAETYKFGSEMLLGLKGALREHDFDTALTLLLVDETLVDQIPSDLLGNKEVRAFVLREFPDYYIRRF